MTTSFINDQIDQELQIADLQSINGGILPYILAAEAVAFILVADAVVNIETGKTIVQHACDGLKEMIDDAVEEGGATGRVDVEQDGVG